MVACPQPSQKARTMFRTSVNYTPPIYQQPRILYCDLFKTLDGSICSAKGALLLPRQKMSLYGLAQMTATEAFPSGGYNQ